MTRKRVRPLPRLHDITAVVFDLDGVLVDSEPMHFRAANRVLQRYGASLSDAENRASIGLGETASWKMWRTRAQIPDSVDVLVAAHTQARLEEIAAVGVEAIDPAVQLARQLHASGMRLAIASSSSPQVIDALLQALGLDSVFTVRISGEDADVHASKPAPDVYLTAAARLGVTPAACLAIEDSGPGVLAAKRAGMTCIAVPNRWTADQDFTEADIVLGSLRYFPLLVL
jgi:HAD superfamily hydrolase (TIGR01509 family)